jgi:hypothetical protein
VSATGLSDRDRLTAVVFGDTFALYDDASCAEFLEPLDERLERNGIERSVFAGKRCLDAAAYGVEQLYGPHPA